MSKSAVYIYNIKVLYNIIFEIKNFFNFDLFYNESEKSIFEQQKKRGDKSFIIITVSYTHLTLPTNREV